MTGGLDIPCTVRAAIAATAVSVAALPASAQSFAEAVRTNAALGLQLCLGGGSDHAAWANAFRAAGFAERVERSSVNSDTTHYFTAPADTVTVELYYGEMPEYCEVSTQHMGVTDAAALLDATVPHLYPGYVRKTTRGAVDPATGEAALCVRYEDPANPIGHVIGVSPGGDAGSCVDNGASRFYSSYRV